MAPADDEVVDAMNRAWQVQPGVRSWLSAVGHKSIGARFIVTALFFMLLGGLDSLVLRSQLALPNSELIDAQTFQQLFTTHGSAMMFLFAVPIVEGLGTYLVPLMVGARDMAFPRLNAFAYYLFLFGGLIVYSPTLADVGNFFLPGDPLPRWIPDAGWFAYPPLSSRAFSPDPSIDIWLIGLTLVEISAVFAAVELIVTILRFRTPGMTMGRMPLFVWSILGMSVAIVLAFPALIVGSTFLELERQLDLPFFDPTRGGDPLLWQHLFWIFGHPEVYVMFLPATGVVSMVIPTFTRRPIIGYSLIVAAIVATAALSLGLWVHHMFATGLPWLGLTIFSAASMVIAIPSGIQVFSWLATLLRGRRLILATPMLFSLGFILTFVLGGLTGVMVASVPFDLQAHDSYFVVAHFHYVLVGGVVFPVFAGLYYWFPKLVGRPLDERLGRSSFWLQFIGLNVAFLPQHNLGLLGMVRRVYTYPDEGWLPILNLASTVGAFVMAAGVLVALLDMALSGRRAPAPADPWGGPSLEWAIASPAPAYNFLAPPIVRGREPLWGPERLDWGAPPDRAVLPSTGGVTRETLVTDAVTAAPQEIRWLPSGTLLPFAAAVAVVLAATALIFSLYTLALLPALVAGGLGLAWMWPRQTERSMTHIGNSLPGWDLTAFSAGPRSAVWTGLVAGLVALTTAALSLLFSVLYLSLVPASWPPPGLPEPRLLPAALSVGLVLAGTVAVWLAEAGIRRAGGLPAVTGLVAAAVFGAAGVAAAIFQAVGAPDPTATAYGAIHLVVHATATLILTLVTIVTTTVAVQARLGHFDERRRMALDNLRLLWGFNLLFWIATFAVNQILPRVS